MSERGPDFDKEARHYGFLAEITDAVELEPATRQRILEELKTLATKARRLAQQERARPAALPPENSKGE
jgi:hypothetical protein